MKKHKLKTGLSALLLIVLALGIATARAELRKVEQVIYGMDCAPCAFGMEKRLETLPGVTNATVSLNKGKATIELKAGNKVTIEDITNAVRKSGFTPKETKILEGSEPAEGGNNQPEK